MSYEMHVINITARKSKQTPLLGVGKLTVRWQSNSKCTKFFFRILQMFIKKQLKYKKNIERHVLWTVVD